MALENNSVRLRVNGLLIENESLIMVQLLSPVNNKWIWMPPGGGVHFGESLQNAVKREMLEETGLMVTVGPLWYLHEVIAGGVHAVEFYYRCEKYGGTLRTGTDPEYRDSRQIIRDVACVPFDNLTRSDIYPEYLRNGFVSDYRNELRHLPKFI